MNQPPLFVVSGLNTVGSIAVNPASDGIDRRVLAELAISNHAAKVVSAR